MPKPIIKILAVALALPVFLLASLSLVNSMVDFSFGNNATYDFVQYWSAFRLLISGEDFYSAQAMLAIQKVLGNDSKFAVMMWNPPWTLLILSPVLIFDFHNAAALWLIFNILFLVSSVLLIKDIYRPNIRPIYLFFPSIAFFPVWEALNWGQLSVFLLFSVALLLHGLCKGRSKQSALALVFLSIKPQLFSVLLLVLLYDALRNGKRKLLYWGCLFLGGFVIASLLLAPQSLNAWLNAQSLLSSNDPALGVYDWKPATLITWLRILVPKLDDSVIWLSPLIICICTLTYLLAKRPTIKWEEHAPIVLSLSLLAAPYAWYCDQSILFYIQLFIFFRALPNNKILLIGLAAIQICYALLMTSEEAAQHHFAFFLPVWVLFSLWVSFRLRTDHLPKTHPE